MEDLGRSARWHASASVRSWARLTPPLLFFPVRWAGSLFANPLLIQFQEDSFCVGGQLLPGPAHWAFGPMVTNAGFASCWSSLFFYSTLRTESCLAFAALCSLCILEIPLPGPHPFAFPFFFFLKASFVPSPPRPPLAQPLEVSPYRLGFLVAIIVRFFVGSFAVR